MAFHKCEDGKKYFESIKISLLKHNNNARKSFTDSQQHYSAGWDDCIREMIWLVDAYREYNKKRLKNG